MDRFTIVPFEPRHLLDIDPPVLTPAQLGRFAAGFAPAGPAYTLVAGGPAVACGGVWVTGEVGHAWAILSEEIRRRPMVLHRLAKRGLERIERELDLARIEASAHEDFVAAHRWLVRLGFRAAGPAPNPFGLEDSYVRYVR